MSIQAIPIGSMIPLTGGSAVDGREFRNGLQLAIEEINADGGILGVPVRPIFIDTGNQTAGEVVRAARTLITEHRVHAIINGYNIGSQNSEYEAVADAGIIYLHHNTLLQHHDTVASDLDRYFGCFMSDPAEYWYGQGFIKFITWLRKTGQWKPRNNRIGIISGPKPYSIVIANAMASAAPQFGWELAAPPHFLRKIDHNWQAIIESMRANDPAVVAITHFHISDLARFHIQFTEAPIDCLLYLQYGALHKSFANIVGERARGAVVGTVIGLLRDERGLRFAERYRSRFGDNSTPDVGCQPYCSMKHYALAAALAGGSGGPGEIAINRRIARNLLDVPYRSVVGTVAYHPKWQAAIPYPDATQDPSLGMPHLFYQLRGADEKSALIAPPPFADSSFQQPPWMKG